MYCAYDRSDRDTVEHCYHSISTIGLVSVDESSITRVIWYELLYKINLNRCL